MNRDTKFILKVREDERYSHAERQFDYGQDLAAAENMREEARRNGFWAIVVQVETLDRSWIPAKR